MRIEDIGSKLSIIFMAGVATLAFSTLILNPLMLFLSVVIGSGLLLIGILGTVLLMIKDIKDFFQKVDQ